MSDRHHHLTEHYRCGAINSAFPSMNSFEFLHEVVRSILNTWTEIDSLQLQDSKEGPNDSPHCMPRAFSEIPNVRLFRLLNAIPLFYSIDGTNPQYYFGARTIRHSHLPHPRFSHKCHQNSHYDITTCSRRTDWQIHYAEREKQEAGL